MASTQGTLTLSPPPPSDLGSYARIMHQHTKRQMMESLSQTAGASTTTTTTQQQRHSPPTATGLPAGVGGSSGGSFNRDGSRDSSQYSYHQQSA
jgi:hypothetical protein